jgi:arylsulfatase
VGPEQTRTAREAYYGSVSYVDEQIGRILEALEKRGWLEQTLIVFTSDHGDMTGDHFLWRKSYAYELSARIPMIVRWPQGMASAQRGTVNDQPVELRDVFPTMLDAAGLSASRPLDGRSLLDLVRGRGSDWRKHIDLEHDVCYDPSNHWNALTDGKSKYIFHARDAAEQLFDLQSDPHELSDLNGSTQHTPLLREWRSKMIAHLAERGDKFVKNGQLTARPERDGFSPHYPRAN